MLSGLDIVFHGFFQKLTFRYGTLAKYGFFEGPIFYWYEKRPQKHSKPINPQPPLKYVELVHFFRTPKLDLFPAESSEHT